MTDSSALPETTPAPVTVTTSRKTWPDYRAVWRWHFYASLFCMPFVIVLSISGAVYLFKPQIEAWLERSFNTLDVSGPRASIAEQVQAALAAVPDSTPNGYELPASERAAARVLVRHHDETIRVFVHPQTLEILGQQPEDERFMRQMFKLHGELWMGDRGSNLVELAASWTIIMIVTGLYLWWPRGAGRILGVFVPRLRSGSRVWWRDLHSVTGIWISAFALLLLATGLPWAKFWGNYFKSVRSITGTAVAQQDWTTGSERKRSGSSSGGEHGGDHGGGRKDDRSRSARSVDLSGFDRVAAAVEPLGLESPVVISPPSRAGANWSAKSMTQNRPHRVNLDVDGATGQIVRRENFADRHWVDRVVGVGIAAHEGQLFGWPNQLLGLLTAFGLVAMSVTGGILWWRRRDRGTLGAPQPAAPASWSWGLAAVVLLMAIYLPLFGASLIVMLVVERLILARVPSLSRWLGLV